MPAVDKFTRQETMDYSPATNAVLVAAHDTNELGYVTRGLYVGVTGDVKVTMHDSGTVTFTAVPGGVILPVRVTKVFNTGTTATNIIALW
jgi:hypothetical protein